MWKFRRYSNGSDYVTINIVHRFTRVDLANILANYCSRFESLDYLADIMQRAWVEKTIRAALESDGEGILVNDGNVDDEWLDWAENQIKRWWPETPRPPKMKGLKS